MNELDKYIIAHPNGPLRVANGKGLAHGFVDSVTNMVCDVTKRGARLTIPGVAGTADRHVVCDKNAADVYGWREAGETALDARYVNVDGDTMTGALVVAPTLSVGTTPATSGTVRLPNAGTVQFRNAGNSNNILALSVDASNNINVGSSSIANGVVVGNASTKLAVFGGTPASKTSATTDLKDSLVTYGLVTDAGATPLNLDGGALTGLLTPPAGTATAGTAPLKLTSGTNLTSPEAGTREYDGAAFYATTDTSGGRGVDRVEQTFRLTATGSTISTIANYFGSTSNISLVSGAEYEIDIWCWYLKSTAGTVTWTLTNSATPTGQNIIYEMSPATGMVAPPGTATLLQGQVYNDATAAKTIATASLTDAVNHYAHIKIFLRNGTGTSLKVQATCGAGTITPGVGSRWIARRLPVANVGTFAA